MNEKKGEKHHENMKSGVIRKACNGDSSALGEIIAHYQRYVKAVIITTALRFGLELDDFTVDDLAQIVWVKFITKKLGLFTDLD